MSMTIGGTSYTNPVYDDYFADPFVLRHDGVYYAYGTIAEPGRTLPALRSTDLVRWEPLGDVLEPLDPPREVYWAPEVAIRDGEFHMYYSAGREEGEEHQLRLAVAERPAGPFVDADVVLCPDEPFSIDAHPFRDDDGRWYLFYCRDFLDGERPGTAIVVDELVEPNRLRREPRTVLRPFAEWNLFEADRFWYGRTWPRWYTIEGPFVVERAGRYYCFFSGGGWRESNYGVGYASADHPLGPWEVATGDGPTILRTRPDEVLGPGHASITQSPNGSDWIVYHAWDRDATARLMRIDRLEWTDEGPRCDGPSLEPRPAPR
jgi:beta-xylosidase